MKLKCNDGVVREFSISIPRWQGIGYEEAECKNCGHQFGVYDTEILKPMFREHVCTWKCVYCGWKGSNPDYNLHEEPRCPNCDSGNPLEIY